MMAGYAHLIPDLVGAVIGAASTITLALLWRYADVLGDGNVERLEREQNEKG